MINKIIRNYIAKRMAGRSDDGIMITLKDPQRVTLGENIMADLLMRNGIDPRAITSEAQLKTILQQIENAEAAAIRNTGIRNTESAKVFNTAGEELDPSKPIIGGTQPGKSIDQDTFIRLAETNTQRMKQKIADKKIDDDLPPPGSRGGPDDIAAPIQSAEESLKDMTEAEIKKNIEAQNKRGIENILKRKNREDVYGLEDYDTTNMSDIKKEIIRTETKLGNLNPDDPGFREKAKPLVDKITELQKKLRDDKADGGRIGFYMGSKFPKGLATLREMVKFFSKGKDKERSGSEILRLVNPKQFNKLLEDPNIYRKFDVKKGIGAPELIKNMQADLTKNRTMMVEEILGAAKNIRKADVDTMERKNEIIKEMIERGIDRETAGEMADTILRMAEATAGMRSTPKLTDEGILELENVLKNMETGGKKKRDLNADGGRIGLKEGSGMTRRTFLKFLAGAASIPIIGKIFKPLKVGKTVTKVPIIKTADVPGKPEWFDQLVNKVILEGDDFTKKLATGERQVVHVKKLDEDTTVSVTQDMDNGVVRVEYDSPANTFEDTVQLQYKKPLPDEGSPNPAAEFEVAESGPVGRAQGPDDFDIDVDEVGGTSIRDLDSDVSKLKEYATGEKPSMKELVKNIERRKRARQITEDPEAQSDAIIRRQGDYDPSDYDDFASGGIARMLGE
jgi:hypothetical protein